MDDKTCKENRYKMLCNEIDMLRGNINRMMITDDTVEVEKMYEVARNRLWTLYTANMERIKLPFEELSGEK